MSNIDFSADSIESNNEQGAAPSGGLERVMALALVMVQQERAVAALEEELREAKAALERTRTEALPDLMTEIGMTMVKLADGSTVEVVPDVHCAITEANRAAAHAWLVENGFGGLIKTKVVTEFGRGELDAAVQYAREANEKFPDHPATMQDGVHPLTLKSFVKEQLEKAAPIPMELFGIRPYNRAKYKAAR